jgi:hypothetical protein
MWCGRPFDAEPRVTLARFRRTRRQALGRRLSLGCLVAGGLALLLAAALATRAAGGAALPEGLVLAYVVVVALPVPVGLVAGLVGGTDVGADVDDLGIHRVPPMPSSFAPWVAVADLRAERRAGRTVVALYLDGGMVIRMAAPYDGRLLSRDPEFERKLFTLRNLWEMHRRWAPHPG